MRRSEGVLPLDSRIASARRIDCVLHDIKDPSRVFRDASLACFALVWHLQGAGYEKENHSVASNSRAPEDAARDHHRAWELEGKRREMRPT